MILKLFFFYDGPYILIDIVKICESGFEIL